MYYYVYIICIHGELFLGRAASAGSPASWHDPAGPGPSHEPPIWQW